MGLARHRVIVGVTGSLTNLEALREAVAVARSRGAVLYAVHVWENDNDFESVFATAHKPEVVPRVRLLNQAFAEALGGQPADVDVRIVVVEGRPKTRLVRLACRDTDLLVVGGNPRPSWRERLTGTVSAHCVRCARCPVLVVPPGEMARAAIMRRGAPAAELRRPAPDRWTAI